MMERKRFQNINYCNFIALFMILIYHYWVLSGSPAINISMPGLYTIISLGEEIGVTMIFVLSGFKIFCMCKNKGLMNWGTFIKLRFIKVAPLYYFSILLVIGLTPSGVKYISKSGILDILTHVLFIHNLDKKYHGSINGALWMMGVIFQYYIIALLLYKCILKNRHVTLVLSIVFTVLMKIITYKYILPTLEMSGTQYFVYGRQLFTALDNFVIGMYIGSVVWNNKKGISTTKGIIYLIFLIFLLVIWANFGSIYGIYVDNLSSYLWHSVLALILAGIIAILGILEELKAMQFLQTIGKNEYGIFLLHFPILQNLLQSISFQRLNEHGQYIVGVGIYLILSFTIGFMLNCLNESFQHRI